MTAAAPVFLHIGLPKAGSTSIQYFLSRSRRALAARGFVVPVSPGDPNHHRITIHAMGNSRELSIHRVYGLRTAAELQAFRAQFVRDFAREAAGWKDSDAIVLTGEHMSRLKGPAEFDRLRRLLALAGERPVRVLVYLRRQDLYCLSDYAQRIKQGARCTWNSLLEEAERPRFDYEAILGRWADAFGRDSITIRILEAGQLVDGDLIADFMAAIGCERGSDFPPASRKNESLDAKSLAFLAAINASYPRFRDGRVNPDRKDLVTAVKRMAGNGPGLRLAPATAKAFLARFSEGNARIARDYLGRPDGRLFYEAPSDEPERAPHLEPEEAAAMTARLKSIVGGGDLAPRPPGRREPS